LPAGALGALSATADGEHCRLDRLALLGFLLAGSLPGIVLGSHLAAWVPDTVLRLGLGTTLIIVANRLVL
jgi:uncharacterized membrane protein YfcA